MPEEKPEKIAKRTLRVAIAIVSFCRTITKDPVSAILVRQLVRSGTSVGANVQEAQDASSREDFIYKIGIALRESKEANYWFSILVESGVVNNSSVSRLVNELEQIIKILTVILKRTKGQK